MMNLFLNVQQQLTLSVQYIANLKIVLPFFLNELPLCEFAKATLIAHAYRSALGERDVKRISWLQSFFVCILLSSAGTCTVALLRGEPFGIINKDEIWLIYGFTYWAMFSNPYLFKALSYVFMTFPMSKAFFIGLSGLRRGYSLVQYGVDGVIIKPEYKKIVARVLCGTLVGSGGGLWNEMLGLHHLQWKLSTPIRFLSPSIDVKISFWSTVAYIMLTILLTNREDAQALGALLFATLLVYYKVISGNSHGKEEPSNNKGSHSIKKTL